MPLLKIKKCLNGFTLAELLIALAILGVIATFTIPKIFTSQQNAQKLANAKDVAAMISGAFQQAKMEGVMTSTSKFVDLTPYMNYVSMDTSGTVIDAPPIGTTSVCTAATPCLKLHNGGYLWLTSNPFNFYPTPYSVYGGLIECRFDPDPLNNTAVATDGPLKAVQFTLFYDGFLTTRGQARPGSGFGGGAYDPSWFSW